MLACRSVESMVASASMSPEQWGLLVSTVLVRAGPSPPIQMKTYVSGSDSDSEAVAAGDVLPRR